jgi:hypothetical protein
LGSPNVSKYFSATVITAVIDGSSSCSSKDSRPDCQKKSLPFFTELEDSLLCSKEPSQLDHILREIDSIDIATFCFSKIGLNVMFRCEFTPRFL